MEGDQVQVWRRLDVAGFPAYLLLNNWISPIFRVGPQLDYAFYEVRIQLEVGAPDFWHSFWRQDRVATWWRLWRCPLTQCRRPKGSHVRHHFVFHRKLYRWIETSEIPHPNRNPSPHSLWPKDNAESSKSILSGQLLAATLQYPYRCTYICTCDLCRPDKRSAVRRPTKAVKNNEPLNNLIICVIFLEILQAIGSQTIVPKRPHIN